MSTLNLLRTGDADHGSPLTELVIFVDGRELGPIAFNEELELDVAQGLRRIEVAWPKWGFLRRMMYGNPSPEALRSAPFEVRLLPGETTHGSSATSSARSSSTSAASQRCSGRWRSGLARRQANQP